MERFALAMPVFSSYNFGFNRDELIGEWLVSTCVCGSNLRCSYHISTVMNGAPTPSADGSEALLIA